MNLNNDIPEVCNLVTYATKTKYRLSMNRYQIVPKKTNKH